MTTDFSQGRVSARIVTQAVPLTLAQLVQLLYSIVDRIYIGHLPELGSAAGFFMSFQFAGQSVFQSLGLARYAVFFSLLRKAVIVVPLTLLLPRLGLGAAGVFLAEPISNFLGGLACFATMYITVYRKLGTAPDRQAAGV